MSGARPVVLGVSLKIYMGPGQAEEWAAEVGDIARAHPAVASGDVELFVVVHVRNLS